MKRSAFSLLELLAVLAISAALVGPAVVVFLETVRSTGMFIEACDTNLAVETALDRLAGDVRAATAADIDNADDPSRLGLVLAGGRPVGWEFVAADDEGFDPVTLVRRCGDDEEQFVIYDVASVTFAAEKPAAGRAACGVTVEVRLRGSDSGAAAAPPTTLRRRYLSRVERPAAGEVRE